MSGEPKKKRDFNAEGTEVGAQRTRRHLAKMATVVVSKKSQEVGFLQDISVPSVSDLCVLCINSFSAPSLPQ